MGNLNHISPGFIVRIVFLFLDFFSALFDMRSVSSIFDSLLRRITGVPLVSAEMLVGIWAVDYNSIEHVSQLADIMSVCSGYDY